MANLFDARRYSYNRALPIDVPTPTAPPPEAKPTPAPAVPGGIPPPQANANPWNTRGDAEAWFRSRGGHELYGLFDQIYKRNPMAGRAFWDSVVGRGRGENDLQAATIHKMFGGDMNAYNDWRNQLHNSGQENQLGNFDLRTGKWNNGGITGDWGWDSVGVGAWDPNYLGLGLQSKQGVDPATGKPYYQAGQESWKNYSAGQYFDPQQGARYAPPDLQAKFVAGQVPGYNQQGQAINPPASPATPATNTPPPAVTAPPPAPAQNVAPATAVNPNVAAPSAANPFAGDQRRGGGYQFTSPGWRVNNR